MTLSQVEDATSVDDFAYVMGEFMEVDGIGGEHGAAARQPGAHRPSRWGAATWIRFKWTSDERTRKEGTYTAFWHFVQSVNEVFERGWLGFVQIDQYDIFLPRGPTCGRTRAYELEVTTVNKFRAPLPDDAGDDAGSGWCDVRCKVGGLWRGS